MAGIEGIIPVQQSFNGGEIGPLVAARIDQTRFITGCKTMLNGFPLVQGPVTRRPGTRFLGTTKFPDKQTKLIPFVFSEDQARVLEFGPGYIRFWTEEGYLTGGERATKEFSGNIKGSGGATGQGWEWKQAGTANFTVPVSGMYELLCVGGGSGGAGLTSYTACSGGSRTGGCSGAGGGSMTTTVFLTAGFILSVTVGAGGGAGKEGSGSGGSSNIGNFASATGGGGAWISKGSSCSTPNNAIGGVGASGVITRGGDGSGWRYSDSGLFGAAGYMGYGNGGEGRGASWQAGYIPTAGAPGYCRIKFVS